MAVTYDSFLLNETYDTIEAREEHARKLGEFLNTICTLSYLQPLYPDTVTSEAIVDDLAFKTVPVSGMSYNEWCQQTIPGCLSGSTQIVTKEQGPGCLVTKVFDSMTSYDAYIATVPIEFDTSLYTVQGTNLILKSDNSVVMALDALYYCRWMLAISLNRIQTRYPVLTLA